MPVHRIKVFGIYFILLIGKIASKLSLLLHIIDETAYSLIKLGILNVQSSYFIIPNCRTFVPMFYLLFTFINDHSLHIAIRVSRPATSVAGNCSHDNTGKNGRGLWTPFW